MKYVFMFVVTGCLLLITSVAEAQQQLPASTASSVEYLKADTTSPLPFSDAVRVGNMLYLSGSIGTVVPGKWSGRHRT